MNEFAALWQQKWMEMLQEKGWPEQAAMPSMGQLPFLMPFMPFGQTGSAQSGQSDPAIPDLLRRVEQLEQRIMELEKQLAKPKRKTRTP